VVIAAEDWEELGHASVSLAHSAVVSQLGPAGQGDFIFAYEGVAVANTDHVYVCGRSRDRLQKQPAQGKLAGDRRVEYLVV
jgi:hypothetical protein